MRSLVAAVVAVLSVSGAGAGHAASIASVSPQGEVAQVRQVSVKFNEAVVAFGDPRLPDPMTLRCQGTNVSGSGRWASDRVWLYYFDDALPPGTRCTLKARPDWKPGGSALTGATEYTFNTGGPAVVSQRPYEGATIAEDQHLLLQLSGAAVETTVVANAWCEVQGIGERIGVRVIGGEPRAALLKARHVDAARAARTLVLACARPLPNGAALRLVWGKGIAAAANPQFTTRV